MSGATIANEIRMIAAGLAGRKNIDTIHVKDLMIDTDRKQATDRGRRRDRDRDSDRTAANSYYNSWARSLQAKVKEGDTNRGDINREDPNPKSKPAPKPTPTPAPARKRSTSRRS